MNCRPRNEEAVPTSEASALEFAPRAGLVMRLQHLDTSLDEASEAYARCAPAGKSDDLGYCPSVGFCIIR